MENFIKFCAYVCLWGTATLMVQVYAVYNGDPGCDIGWQKLNKRDLCVRVGPSSAWDEAFKFCHQNQAGILDYQDRDAAYLIFLDRNGIQLGWSGERVRNGRFVTDSYTVNPSQLNRNVFSPDTTVGCATFNISMGPVTVDPTEGSGFGSLGELKLTETSEMVEPSSFMDLYDCQKKLPFICGKKPDYNKDKILTSVPGCPNGWVGNITLQNCFKVFEMKVEFQQAIKTCSHRNAQLMQIRTEVQLNIANNLINTEVAAISRVQVYNTKYWVEGQQGICDVLFSVRGQILKWDCKQKLPFICSKKVSFSNFPVRKPKLSLNLSGSTRSRLIREGEREIITSTFAEEEVPSTATCSSTNFVPKLQKLQWVKDGSILNLFSAKNESTLTFGTELYEYLWSKSRGVTLQDLAGYYWCQIIDLRTNTILQSEKIYYNFKEYKVYAVSMRLLPDFVYTRDSIRYNLLHDISKNLSTIFNVFSEELVPENSIPYAKVNSFRKKGQIVDFQFFSPNQNKDFISEREEMLDAKERLPKTFDFTTISNGKFLKFVSTDYCFSRKLTYNIENISKTVDIFDLRLGKIWKSPEICGIDKRPMVSLECQGNKISGVYWSGININQNCNFTNRTESSITRTLSDIAKNLTTTNAEMTTEDIKKVLDSSDTISDIDVLYTTAVIDTITDNNVISKKTLSNVVQIVNRLSMVPDRVLSSLNQEKNTSNRLLSNLDELEQKVILRAKENFKVVSSSTSMLVNRIDKSSSVLGLIRNNYKSTKADASVDLSHMSDDLSVISTTEVMHSTTDVAIFFNEDFVQTLTGDESKDVRLSFRIFNDNKLFQEGKNSTYETSRFEVNSKIISATASVNGQYVSDLNGTKVTAIFLPYKKLKAEKRSVYSVCAFWNLEESQWSTDGCEYSTTIDDRDICTCNHLTNFAILLDYYGQDYLVPDDHQLALSIITYIGLSLSIAGLGLTVLSFILFRKLRKGRAQKTLFNLAVAMLCSWIVFLSGITQTVHHVGCLIVAILLHYFILVSFMWMLMEGLLQYLLFVKVLGTYFDNYMWKTAIPAWGLPAIPVIIMLALDVELYNGGNSYCWMALNGFYYGFAVPVGLIILANIIIYIMVTISICKRKKINSADYSNNKQNTLTSVRASFCCFIILGISWIFGFLAISDARIVFQYLFTIINTFQGFFIFVLFTLRDKNVRDYWKSVCCGQESKSSKSKSTDSGPRSNDYAFTEVDPKSSKSTNGSYSNSSYS